MSFIPAFLYDDAYITLASAQAFLAGADPHYPQASPFDGVTSPFHAALVAVLLLLFPPLWALLISCLLGTLALIAGLIALSRTEGLGPVETGLLVILALGTGMSIQHHINGLETSWAMAALCWSLVFHRRRLTSGVALSCGTLPFVRPELALWSFALLGYEVWKTPRHLARLGILSLASALPWLVLMFTQTGGVLPTTLAAKRDWFAEDCWSVWRRLEVVGRGLLLWLVFSAGAVAGIAGLVRSAAGRLAMGVVGAILLTWSFSVPNVLYSYQRHRYYAPFIVWLVFGLTQLRPRDRRLAISVGALAALVTSSWVMRLEPGMIAGMERARAESVAALQKNGADRVLLHDAGYLAWADAAPTFIDMVGLKTPLAADLHHDWTAPSCGEQRSQAIGTIAEKTDARFLFVWDAWDGIYGVTDGLRSAGWMLDLRAAVGAGGELKLYDLRQPGSTPSGQATNQRRGKEHPSCCGRWEDGRGQDGRSADRP